MPGSPVDWVFWQRTNPIRRHPMPAITKSTKRKLSLLQLAKGLATYRRPAGSWATELTLPVCSDSVAMLNPVATCHSLTIPSLDADATIRPSGEKATELTQDVCPRNVLVLDPVATSHSLTVPALDANASILPLGEKATLPLGDKTTELTASVCSSVRACYFRGESRPGRRSETHCRTQQSDAFPTGHCPCCSVGHGVQHWLG